MSPPAESRFPRNHSAGEDTTRLSSTLRLRPEGSLSKSGNTETVIRSDHQIHCKGAKARAHPVIIPSRQFAQDEKRPGEWALPHHPPGSGKTNPAVDQLETSLTNRFRIWASFPLARYSGRGSG